MSCHSHTDAHADTHTDAHAHAHADTDANANADTHTDTNADADTHTNADTYANTYGSVIARHCSRKRRPFIGFMTAQCCRALRSAQPVFFGGP